MTSNVDQLLDRARSLYDAGKIKEATNLVEEAHRISPDDIGIFYTLGICYSDLGELQASAEAFLEVTSRDPEHWDAWSLAGDRYAGMGKWEEVVDCYSRAARINPDDYELQRNLGTGLQEINQLDKAIACYDRAIAINQEDISSWFGKAECLGQLSRRNQADEALKRGLAIKPQNVREWSKRGYTLKIFNRFKEALESFLSGLRMEPENWYMRLHAGLCHDALKQYDQAFEQYQRAYEIDPRNSDIFFYLGVARRKQGAFDDAMEYLERAPRKQGTKKQIRICRALMQAQSGNARPAKSASQPRAIKPEYYQIFDTKAGGMGIVFLCYDKTVDDLVAIKTFQDKFLGDWQRDKAMLEEFLKEARTWVLLGNHPNIVRARGVFSMQGKPHIFMDCIMGGSLADVLRTRSLDPETIVRMAIQFCEGMQHAHNHGVMVHRDIKPQNIMVTEDGEIKITDFGLSLPLGRLIGNGKGAGTPPYMAPEQFPFSRQEVDHCADIYGFGITLYEMITGRLPFIPDDPGDMEAWWRLHQGQEPPPLHVFARGIPDDLQRTVMKCIEKEPAQRYQSFADLKHDLAQLIDTPEPQVSHAPQTQTDEIQETHMKGISHLQMDRFEEAIGFFDTVLESNPDHWDAWAAKGEALRWLMYFDEAIECCRRSLAINKTQHRALTIMGNCYLEQKRLEKALPCFRKATRVSPKNESAWHALARCQIDLQMYQDALESLDRALQIDPDDYHSWSEKGNIFFDLREYQQAIKSYQKALRANPRHAPSIRTLATCYLATGNIRDGMELIDEALELNSEDAWAWYNKALCLGDQLGQPREALYCLEQCLNIDPDNEQARRAYEICSQRLRGF